MSGQPDDDGRVAGSCPSCGARVSHGQEWCTLCHLRLDAAPAPTAEDGSNDPTTDPIADRYDDPSVGEPAETLMPGERDPDPPRGTLPPGVAEAMLAELAASSAADRPLASGPLAGTGRGLRIVLALGASLLLVAIAVGLLTLVGQLL